MSAVVERVANPRERLRGLRPLLSATLQADRLLFAVVVGMGLLSVALSIILNVLFGRLFAALEAHAWLEILGTVAAFAAVDLVGGPLTTGRNYARTLFANRFGNRLRAGLLDRVMTASASTHDWVQTGDLETRLTNDIRQVANAGAEALPSLIENPIMLAAAVVYLWILSPALALVVGPLGFVLYLINLPWQRRLYDQARAVRETESHMNQLALDSLQGIVSVQALQVETAFARRYRSILQQYLGVYRRQITSEGGLDAVMGALGFVPFVVVLLLGGYLVVTHKMGIPAFMVASNLVNFVAQPYALVATAWGNIQTGRASLDRLTDWRPAEELPPPTLASSTPAVSPGDGPPTVTVKDISFRYGDGPLVLAGLSASLPPGRLTALVGPNGSGKSSLGKILLGFYTPAAGEIRWNDVRWEDLGVGWVRSHTAYVPQDPFLVTGTVADNVRLADETVDDDRVREVLRRVGLPDSQEFLAEQVGERGKTLSGGQRLRLAVSRALVTERPFVLLDEPTASLDREGIQGAADLLGKLCPEHTVLVITHEPVLVEAAHHVVRLDAPAL